MTLETIPWDSTQYLETDADIAIYIEAALETGDPEFLAYALGIVARAKGMTAVARKAGLTRASLYKALSAKGKPEFATIMRVMQALNLRFKIAH